MACVPTAAILVGGRAHRMEGQDKSGLLVGGRTILQRQLDALSGIASRIVLVTSPTRAIAGVDAEVVVDRWPGCGSLGGVATALDAAGTDTLVVACDMPFLTPAFLRFVAESAPGADVVLPRTADGHHPLCARYATACLPAFVRRIEARHFRILDAIAECEVREIGPDDVRRFDAAGRLLMNVNTPDDLGRAVAHAEGALGA